MNRRLFITGALAVATSVDAPGAARIARISVAGRTFATMQEAADVGGKIDVSAGELRAVTGSAATGAAHFRKAAKVIGHGTRIIGQSIENKGTFVVDADTWFVDLDISGARGDGIGAAFRHQSGNLHLQRVKIHDCENGLLGPAGYVDGTLAIDACDVFGNGTGTGQTHGLYVGEIRKFTCANSRFRDTRIGHHIKSRALQTVILGCQVGTDFSGSESYNIDVPQGGDATVLRCRMRQGPRTDNEAMLNFGGERNPRPGGSLLVADTVFESTAGGVGVRIHANVDVIGRLTNCAFVGVDMPINGRCVMRNCSHNGRRLRDGLHVG